jgi:hypothetical protein
MGKSGNKAAAREAATRNRQQAAENEKIRKQNEERVRAAEERNRQLEKESKRLNAEAEWKTKRTKAANDARAKIYDYRIELYKNSKNLLSDWELQEKRRFLKAKTGTGQVGREDTAITGKARKKALADLELGEDYWRDKAQVAFDKAWNEFGDYQPPLDIEEISKRPDGRPSSLPNWTPAQHPDPANNTPSTPQSIERGRGYTGSGTAPTTRQRDFSATNEPEFYNGIYSNRNQTGKEQPQSRPTSTRNKNRTRQKTNPNRNMNYDGIYSNRNQTGKEGADV